MPRPEFSSPLVISSFLSQFAQEKTQHHHHYHLHDRAQPNPLILLWNFPDWSPSKSYIAFKIRNELHFFVLIGLGGLEGLIQILFAFLGVLWWWLCGVVWWWVLNGERRERTKDRREKRLEREGEGKMGSLGFFFLDCMYYVANRYKDRGFYLARIVCSNTWLYLENPFHKSWCGT